MPPVIEKLLTLLREDVCAEDLRGLDSDTLEALASHLVYLLNAIESHETE
jgi:hypothetical protein